MKPFFRPLALVTAVALTAPLALVMSSASATAAQSDASADAVGGSDEILRYTFDSDAGTSVLDSSGNGRNGELVAGGTWNDGALQLDGDDDFVRLPDDLLADVTDITVEADVWIDPAQASPYFLYGLGNTTAGAGDGYLFTSGDDYRTSLTTGNWTTEQTVSQSAAVPRGTWAHLAYTLAGTTATLYLDGVKVGSSTVTIDPKDIGAGRTTANYIGRSNYDADNRFRGQIREFAIYDRALSPAEVLSASGNTTTLSDVTIGGDVLKTAPIIDSVDRVVTFPVKPGVALTSLAPTYTTAAGVVASPASGTVRDLSSPQRVVLTPLDGGSPTTWTLKAISMGSPAIPGLYADPNIAVFGDTYYVYATTDGVPGWGGNQFWVWSSKDLVDWTRSDQPILTLDGANGNVPWAVGNAWAPTISEKDGKYYFYFSGHNAALDRKTIGVAVADSPTGPFAAQPTAMITNGEAVNSGQAIDPAAFTDPATGKSYLFWGNGVPVYAELADDMISVKADTIKRIDGLTDFREGAFVNVRNGLYHLTYSIDDTGSENYKVGYATATSIDGPWTYRGVVLEKDPALGILATGHDSIVNVPGTDDWYIAYHRFAFSGGDGTHRETTIDRVTFSPTTGLMEKVRPTLEGASAQEVVDVAVPAVTVTASSRTRCVQGKVVLSVAVTNPNAFAIKVVITSAYGVKTIDEIGAGKSATHAFTTRDASVASGQVSVSATAFVAGKPATTSAVAPYPAASCR
ncbi:family 43 glycosylhydrolase [Frigoribacterium sp. 9N]|uniref:family 43 glycosylhydrolase n=1 Tax=Frigoribacterium sp. 9N TaxID=2653144 RepID=UPI001358FE25|nr:family 43 glycosylhydrolase [Frigoribacterium sp. 9N]